MKLADVFAFLPLSPKSKVMGVTAHLCAMQAELTLHLTQPPNPWTAAIFQDWTILNSGHKDNY